MMKSAVGFPPAQAPTPNAELLAPAVYPFVP